VQVRDSSRYFVLKIESPDGRHAFIGLAFNDRNASFDFNVAMQEFQKVRT
jgi:adaptin ear-binding coat-associated protein 1/2